MTHRPALFATLGLTLGLPLLVAACATEDPDPVVAPDPVALSEVPVLVEPEPVVEPVLATLPVLEEDGLAYGPDPTESSSLDELAPATQPALAGLPTTEITLRHGESLFLLADWTGVTSEELAELNGIDVTEFLVAGQSLLVPLHAVTVDQLESARTSASERRLERYMRGRGGLAGIDTHRVHTGETAWSIARDGYGLPTWVLAAYNPDIDLDHLRIGDSLQVPVLADTVADLGAVD